MLKIAFNLVFRYDLFRPTAMLNDFNQLKEIVLKQEINYLIFDKDDTVTPLYGFQVKDQKIIQTLNSFVSGGRFIAIVSNSVIVDQHNQPAEMRLKNGNHYFDILNTTYRKPWNGQQIEDHMRIQQKVNPSHSQFKKQKVAIVGDRLCTDILLGNLMGWKSYLVKPLQKTTIQKHGLPVYIMRKFQNFLISRSDFKKYKSETSK